MDELLAFHRYTVPPRARESTFVDDQLTRFKSKSKTNNYSIQLISVYFLNVRVLQITTQSGFTERWLHHMVENSSAHLGLSIVFPIKNNRRMHIYTFLHEYMHIFIDAYTHIWLMWSLYMTTTNNNNNCNNNITTTTKLYCTSIFIKRRS